MIGKIVTGKSFGGAVEYVLRKEKARLLDSDGVDTESIRSIIDDFNFQRKARREIAKVVGHISLSFHRNDAPKLTDDRMRELAAAYMECMGIANTQYIVARHNDTEHPHLHIIYNRVKYDRTLVADKNERRRNVKVCKQLKRRYGLTFSNGRQNIKTERLHGADKVRQEVFDAITRILPKCDRIADLSAKLKRQGIGMQFIHRGNDPKKAVQGVTFTKDGLTFKGSQVDRKFSYAGLSKMIRERVETLARETADEEIKYMRERRREQERDTTPKPRKEERPQPPQVQREETPPPATVPADTTGFSRTETLRAAAGRNRRYTLYAGAMAAVAGEPDAADNRSPQRCKYAARILVRQCRRVAIPPYRPAPQG